MNFSETFLEETARIAGRIDREAIERLADLLAGVRDGGGRVFFLGVGGSAANASHAVNDFRKLAGIEAYAPTDNVSELSARINDEGWDSSYAEWLKGSRISAKDAVVILSVGGGDPERGVSLNLVRAIETAKSAGAGVCGIVGREGGATAAAASQKGRAAAAGVVPNSQMKGTWITAASGIQWAFDGIGRAPTTR